jgi:hypothetical protein
LDYVIDSTTEKLHCTGGIAIVGKILQRIGFGKNEEGNSPRYPGILKSVVGLFTQGRTTFEEIRLFRNDELFQNSLNLTFVPAAETFRLYLEKMIPEQEMVEQTIRTSNIRLLKSAIITAEKVQARFYVPIDVDTSPFDNSKSRKEGVSWTYKKFEGYHPIFSYIGQEGYMLNCELREGKQHCQNGTPEFLKDTLTMVNELSIKDPVLFRLDGGNDSQDTIRILAESGCFYIVKRNLRRELPEYWLSVARAEGEVTYQDEKKIVYTGFHTGKTPDTEESLPESDVIFRVVERYMTEDGTRFLFPELEVQTFWTNLFEEPEDIIELYHAHGTSEQFHSELKTDMNVERLPSGKFAVNAMLLQTAMLSFNILRFIGQTALSLKEILPYKTDVLRKRLRKVIDDLIRVAVKIVRHSRQTVIKLWKDDPWLNCFRKIYDICCNL